MLDGPWGEGHVDLPNIHDRLYLRHGLRPSEDCCIGNSWYVGANVAGKPRVVMPYMGGAAVYTEKIEAVARENYTGFVFARSRLCNI